ncbi:AMP-binding protein [Schaalia sp. 19OD2882]|uniref:AMP-binding protein n=1 Tax=Schaalia sp. 19OD2882 TaxID=2794089 RepID=UPI001C1F0A36|nr:AMP-binding protein [Schaalia sp. 19OD2882]QWW18751.1 AMP-binding protein [Schaalia sp. 19OD2882]
MVSKLVEQSRELYDPGCPFDVPVPTGSLYELLETTASFYPDRVALDYFGHEATYAQVHDQVLRAAQVLHSAGVGKGDVVAISLPNCPQAFAVFHACMRIGAVAAQHNPLAPAAEVHGQLGRHHGQVAVVWEKCVDNFPTDGSTALRTVFTVDISAHMPAGQRFLLALPVARARATRDRMRAARPSRARSWDAEVARARRLPTEFPHPGGDDRAVILHTGGTNGVPKSVPLTHRNIGANVNQCIFWVWKLHEGAEVFWSLLPYFHAFGLTFFLCAAVRKAATQVLLPSFDVDLALESHRRRPVTFFVGVPPMFERIEKRASETGTSLRSIRFGVAGAMPLSTASAARWEKATGGMIVEGYGLSETSPVLMGAPLSEKRHHGVLGVPFANTDLRLADLDDPSIDVEEGQPGEILVKGPQVFEGYLDAPEETARVFTEDGWFRTGDIGVCEGGYIRMADRKKELILSGGFNVYPSQVEAAIRTMPGVKDVAVVGLPSGDAREDVVAALLLEEDAPTITIEQVRAWAEKRISHYALPRHIAFLTDLPRNPLGKVMRRRVKEQLLDPASKLLEQAGQAVGGAVSQAGQAVSGAVSQAQEIVQEHLPQTRPSALGEDEDGQDATRDERID